MINEAEQAAGDPAAPGARFSIPAVNWALDEAPVPGGLLATLVAVARRADDRGMGSAQSVAEIARVVGKSTDQARADLRALKSLGLLLPGDESELQHVAPGQRPAVYDLPLHAKGPKPARRPRNDPGRSVGRPPTVAAVSPSGATGPERLYFWYDRDGILLYIGVTNDLAHRQTGHAKRSSWAIFAVQCRVEDYSDRDSAEDTECEAIAELKPLFNRTHNDTPEARERLVRYLAEKDRLDLLTPAMGRG